MLVARLFLLRPTHSFALPSSNLLLLITSLFVQHKRLRSMLTSVDHLDEQHTQHTPALEAIDKERDSFRSGIQAEKPDGGAILRARQLILTDISFPAGFQDHLSRLRLKRPDRRCFSPETGLVGTCAPRLLPQICCSPPLRPPDEASEREVGSSGASMRRCSSCLVWRAEVSCLFSVCLNHRSFPRFQFGSNHVPIYCPR